MTIRDQVVTAALRCRAATLTAAANRAANSGRHGAYFHLLTAAADVADAADAREGRQS